MALLPIGEINLGDLTAIRQLQGQESLPYPFAHTHPVNGQDPRISSVVDRLENGDLSAFREWAQAYVDAEIWVAGRVHHSNDNIPDCRVLAYRAGKTGYLASQRDNDIVEVSRLSALDLGAAVAGSVGLTEPGTLPRIVVPGYIGYFAEAATDYDEAGLYSVRDAVHRSSEPAPSTMADHAVTAIATIQSRWRPPRIWGVDWTKNYITFVKIDAHGDYIYTPDFGYAVPLTQRFLRERIDSLIAEDISALRIQRGI